MNIVKPMSRGTVAPAARQPFQEENMTDPQPPKYAIINTTDAPKKDLIVEYINSVGYCYMARKYMPYKMAFDGMSARRPTAIEDFGFTVIEREYQTDFERHGPSIATYEDGKIRDWQDIYSGSRFSLPRVELSDIRSKDADDETTMFCDFAGSYCTGEFCEDYGCAKECGFYDGEGDTL